LAFLKLGGGGGARRGACTLHLDKPALELVLKAQNLQYGTPQNATVHTKKRCRPTHGAEFVSQKVDLHGVYHFV
jgi:hypothetical protein